MAQLITTLGRLNAGDMGLILPHEHVFVELGTGVATHHMDARPAEVIAQIGPELERARTAGVTALVECTPEGVGRRADILQAVSAATGFPIVVPTGIYREPWVPQWVHDATGDALRDWMLGELTGEIDGSGVQAGWIKLSAGNDGLTSCEEKILRAAAQAGAATHAVIGSHTIRGQVVMRQLDILEEEGYTAGRFIWIHTQAEPDFDLHLEAARRGAWLEYDAIGSDDLEDEAFVALILRVLDAGHGDRLLLSHDRGWYDPSLPGGGVPKPFTYLSQVFLPRLRAAGVDDQTVRQLTCTNPFTAFAR